MTETTNNNLPAVRENELPIKTMGDLEKVGTALMHSGMFGSGTPAKGITIAAICLQERMSFLEFKRTYHVSNQGDVMMRSDRMLAEFMNRGGKVKWLQFDDVAAVAEWSYGDNQNLKIGFTFAEAEKAGYVKAGSNWTKDPGSQLRARTIARAVRMLCPAAICGVYAPEEMADVYGSEPAEPTGPKVLDPAEAAKRVNATVFPTQAAANPEPETQQPAAEPEVVNPTDFSVCPIPGKKFGMAWADMDADTLRTASNFKHEAMQPGHFAAIKAAMAAKK